MNSELILKLSREAEFLAREHVRDCETYGYTMFEGNAEDEFHAEFRYEFAKLLIEECIEQFKYSNSLHSETSAVGMNVLVEDVKHYFGLEE